jgi:RNA polymerase sigma-70 factor, ECF subfamily
MAIGAEFPNVLAAARTGEEWAWERLFESVARPLCAYARAHRAADPDDLCGEVLLRVVRDLGRFAGDEAGFRSWTFTIAHHRLVDERRRQERAKSQRSTVTAVGLGADELALENLEVAGWHHRLARLSPDQRDVLLLRVVAGLGTDEVARVLGKRAGHVRVLLHRACGALRDDIDRVTR